jgi:hypothetical protein
VSSLVEGKRQVDIHRRSGVKKGLATVQGIVYLVGANYSTPFFALLMVPLLAGIVRRNISKQL